MSNLAARAEHESIFRLAKAAPMLTHSEEIAAVERGDHDLLVRAHLRLVIKIAAQYPGYKLSFADLYGEGCIGLMQACQRYKLGEHTRFATYAIFWIKAAILDFVLRNVSLVRLGTTAAGKKLFFRRGELFKGTAEEVADRLSVTVEDVELARSRAQVDVSLNVPVTQRENNDALDWIDVLEDSTPNPEELLENKQEDEHRAAKLKAALATLSEREREILLLRNGTEDNGHGKSATLDAISLRYGVSRERIRQIETRATLKVKQALGLLPMGSTIGRRRSTVRTKKCSACGVPKAHELFYRSRKHKSGRGAYCKACAQAHRKAWTVANPERNRVLANKSYRKNRRARLLSMRAYHQKRKRIALANAAHGGSLPALPLEHHGLPPLPIASGVISRA